MNKNKFSFYAFNILLFILNGQVAVAIGSVNQSYLNNSLTNYCVPSGSCMDIASYSNEGCICGMGRYYANRVCNDCPAGYYTNTSNAKYCNPCIAGTYQPSVGSASCISCGANVATCNPINGTIISCSGFYVLQNGTCKQIVCPIGSYKATINNGVCPIGSHKFSITNGMCGIGNYRL